MIPFIEFDVPHWEDHSPRMDSTPHQPLHHHRQHSPSIPARLPPDGVHMGGGRAGKESSVWHAWQAPQPMSALILMGGADP